MGWNFLAPKTSEVTARAPLSVVSDALSQHLNNLRVRNGWLDFSTSLLSSDYLGNGHRFTIDQRINLGKSDIWIHADGEGREEGLMSSLSIRYTVGPRWLVGFLWLFQIIGIGVALTVVPAMFRQVLPGLPKIFPLYLVPVMFTIIPLVINRMYLAQVDKLHREVMKALAAFE